MKDDESCRPVMVFCLSDLPNCLRFPVLIGKRLISPEKEAVVAQVWSCWRGRRYF